MTTSPATHLGAHPLWCGRPRQLEPGSAEVEWSAPPEAGVDAEGLVHGGFTFGVADYAAMLAVNDPLVVLLASEVRFPAPVAVGDVVIARATLEGEQGRRRRVHCVATVGATVVLEGHFDCVIAREHPLARGKGANP
jgi:acyl-coenzyme A thioesterase PaaI-like protein